MSIYFFIVKGWFDRNKIRLGIIYYKQQEFSTDWLTLISSSRDSYYWLLGKLNVNPESGPKNFQFVFFYYSLMVYRGKHNYVRSALSSLIRTESYHFVSERKKIKETLAWFVVFTRETSPLSESERTRGKEQEQEMRNYCKRREKCLTAYISNWIH